MGRDCYVDPEDEIPAGVWHARFQQIIHGKKGQQILADLERALLEMPRHRLAKDQIVTWTGDCCLIGAYVVQKQVDRYIDRDSVIVALLLEDYDEWTSMQRSASLAQDHGIPWTLAWEMAQANDMTVQEIIAQTERYREYNSTGDYQSDDYVSSPEERWASCLALIREWRKEGGHDVTV